MSQDSTSRLEELLIGLGEATQQTIAQKAPETTGWTWESDHNGAYILCSPSIKEALGYSPEDFLGKSFTAFAVQAESRPRFATAFTKSLEEQTTPLEFRITYQNAAGESVPTMVHILSAPKPGDEKGKWKGFTQIIPAPAQPKPVPAAPKTSRPATFSPAFSSGQDLAVPLDALPLTETAQRSLLTGTLATDVSSLAIPVELQEDLVGVLEFVDENRQNWSTEEQELVKEVAYQLSLALENAYLFQQTETQAWELEVLNNMARDLSEILEIGTILETIYNYISQLMDASNFLVAFYDEDQETLSFPFAVENGEPLKIPTMRKRRGLVQQVIDSKSPLLISQDVDQARESLGLDRIVVGQPAQSWLGVPMLIGNEVIGAMALQSPLRPGTFKEHHRDLLLSIARQSAIAIQNTRLFNQTQAALNETQILLATSNTASQSLVLEEILKNVLRQIIASTNIDASLISLFNPQSQQLELGAEHDLPDPLKQYLLENGFEGTLCGLVHDKNQPISFDDLADAPKEIKTEGLVKFGFHTYLGIPISFREKNLGTLCSFGHDEEIGLAQNIELLQAIAGQIGVAIENANLFQETQQRSGQLQAAAEVSQAASSILEPNPLLEQTAHLIRDRFGLYYVGIFLVDEEGIWSEEPERWAVLRAGTGEEGRLQVERRHKLEIGGGSMVGQCISQGEANISQHAPEEARRFANPLLPDTQSEMALPLISRGNMIGAMSIQSAEPNAFSKEDIAVFQTMADQVANALQNANLVNQTQQNAKELTILNEMSRVLSSQLNIHEIIHTIYQFVSRLMDTSYFFTALYDPQTDMVSFPLVVENNRQSEIPPMKKRQGLTQHVIDTKEALLISENVEQVITDLGLERIIVGEPAKSWLGVPMSIGDEVMGVISVQNANRPRMFNDHHRELLLAVARQTAIAIQNADLFEQTQRRLADLATIQETTSDLSAALTLDGVVNALLAHLVSATKSNEASLFVVEGEEVIRTGFFPANENSPQLGERFLQSDFPLTKAVIETEEPIALAADDPRLQEYTRKHFEAAGIAFNVTVPIVGPEGVQGTISLSRKSPADDYQEEEINLVTTLANQAAVAIQNARLYEEQRETAEKLREVDQLKSQFLANMSHELRTPLNSIIGFSRVILKGIDGPISDLQKQDLGAIHASGQHLLTMINDILDISKIESGKMELSFESVDLGELIESILVTASGLLKDKSVELHKVLEPGLPEAHADPVRLRQVLLNFLSNAAKFTEEGNIIVEAKRSPDSEKEILVSVTDTGEGISKEGQKKLFKRFSQVDGSTTREREGTGLGLSISRELIHLQGGTIGVKSELGEGSTFFFTIPVAEPKEIPQEKGEKSILVIEDDENLIDLYKQYLAQSGYQIISLTDPKQAIEYTRAINPDIITLDLLFSDEEGWEILRVIKGDPQLRDIPVIICSILDERDKATELGADAYLTKPILENDLVSAIERVASD